MPGTGQVRLGNQQLYAGSLRPARVGLSHPFAKKRERMGHGAIAPHQQVLTFLNIRRPELHGPHSHIAANIGRHPQHEPSQANRRYCVDCPLHPVAPFPSVGETRQFAKTSLALLPLMRNGLATTRPGVAGF
jgi:hypothetical protein